MMSELAELYQDLIIDHGRSPRNHRVLDKATGKAEGFNPLCGDRVTIYVLLDEHGQIQDIAFQGAGCAICMASASLMTQRLKSCTTEQAQHLFEAVRKMVTEDVEPNLDEVGKIAALAGVRRYPMRVKCATLPWHTMLSALRGGCDDPVSTE